MNKKIVSWILLGNGDWETPVSCNNYQDVKIMTKDISKFCKIPAMQGNLKKWHSDSTGCSN